MNYMVSGSLKVVLQGFKVLFALKILKYIEIYRFSSANLRKLRVSFSRDFLIMNGLSTRKKFVYMFVDSSLMIISQNIECMLRENSLFWIRFYVWSQRPHISITKCVTRTPRIRFHLYGKPKSP